MQAKPTYEELEQKVANLGTVVAELERAEKINQTLYRVSTAVNTTSNLDELYASIHKILHSVIDPKNFYIAIYQKSKKTIYFPFFRDEFDDDFSYEELFTETNSLTGEVILAGKPLLLSKEMLLDRARANKIIGTVPEIWLGFPLMVKGAVIGVMATQSYNNPEKFSETDLETLSSVSDQIAIAIERKRMEEALRKSEEQYRSLLEASPDAIVAYNPEGHIIYINPAFEKTYGWQAGELAGRIIDFVPEHEKEKTRQAVLRNLGGEDVSLETQRLTKDGHLLDIHLKTSIVRDEKDQLQGTIVIHRDITEQKRVAAETNRLRNLLGNIVNSMPSVLVGIDQDGRVTQWNQRAAEETGVAADDAAGRKIDEVFPRLSAEMDRIGVAMEERRALHDPKRPYRADGETRYEDITVYPLIANGVRGAVIRVDDVTERVQLEEMMVQSEKMLTVGGLAAGMAHEINNPLAGIMQNTQIARNRLSGASPADQRAAEAAGTTIETIRAFQEERGIIDMLEAVLDSGSRAAKIVNNMLSFSRKGDASRSKHSLPALLDSTVELAGSDYDLKKKYDFRKIEIYRDYHSGTPDIFCEGSKIQQVFLNILKNGAEAMAGNSTATTVPRFILRVQPELDMVRVEIEDNGPGMAAAVRKRIFDPFYTTKGNRGGTGLGLSVSYFIIMDNHDGSLTVESEQDKGARFIIKLPC